MSEQPIDQFVSLDFLKTMLQVPDKLDDNLFSQFADESNKKVQSAISRYVDTPIGEGSEYYSTCKDASLAYARSLHALDIELIEKSKAYVGKYNTILYGEDGTKDKPMAGGLIQELIAARTSKTKTVLAVFDPRGHKVTLPSQHDLFTSERFA